MIQQFILEFLDSHRGAILLTDGQYKAVCSRLGNSIRNQPRKQSFEAEAASGALAQEFMDALEQLAYKWKLRVPEAGFWLFREKFAWIAEELKSVTNRVMVSIVDFYQKTDRRLSQLEKEEGFSFDRDVLSSAGTTSLLKDLADIAGKNNIEIFTCAEERDYSQIGVPPGRCIDDRLLTKIWSLNLEYKKDPYQRGSCLCMVSKDIGINDTCIHGCPYCYSTTNYAVAERRFNEHNPDSPILWGKPQKLTETVEETDAQMRLFR